jgi:hypothetical protein
MTVKQPTPPSPVARALTSGWQTGVLEALGKIHAARVSLGVTGSYEEAEALLKTLLQHPPTWDEGLDP